MEKLDPSVAQQIVQGAVAVQQQRTGHEPQSVAMVLKGDTLRITLHGGLLPAGKGLSQNAEGAVQVQEFHWRHKNGTRLDLTRDVPAGMVSAGGGVDLHS